MLCASVIYIVLLASILNLMMRLLNVFIEDYPFSILFTAHIFDAELYELLSA